MLTPLLEKINTSFQSLLTQLVPRGNCSFAPPKYIIRAPVAPQFTENPQIFIHVF